MKAILRKEKTMGKRQASFLLAAILFFGMALQMTVYTQAASVNCKTLCQAALAATGGSDKLQFQSSKVRDFGGFSVSEAEKVSSVMYVCDDKEVYSICVAKASSKSDAAELLKSLKSYKANNSSSDYLSDYSSTEQKVFKNAICGRSGKYIWYIAMSASKSVNKKGQTALKKKL